MHLHPSIPRSANTDILCAPKNRKPAPSWGVCYNVLQGLLRSAISTASHSLDFLGNPDDVVGHGNGLDELRRLNLPASEA